MSFYFLPFPPTSCIHYAGSVAASLCRHSQLAACELIPSDLGPAPSGNACAAVDRPLHASLWLFLYQGQSPCWLLHSLWLHDLFSIT